MVELMGEHKFMLIGVAVAAVALLILVKKKVLRGEWGKTGLTI